MNELHCTSNIFQHVPLPPSLSSRKTKKVKKKKISIVVFSWLIKKYRLSEGVGFVFTSLKFGSNRKKHLKKKG